MSELIKNNDNRATIRWKLLTSASALALTVSSIGIAHAEDADRPLIWIELGGQAESISGQGEVYAPGFLAAYSTSSILQEKATPLQAQRPPLFSTGEEAKISFQPEGSDWVFSGAVRIGRSSNSRHVDHQTDKVHYRKYKSGQPAPGTAVYTQESFADTHVHHNESHSVLDFMAGKDVGLGMFGFDGSSVLSGGVRIAQFSSHSSVDMRARPDLQFKYETLAAFGHPSIGVQRPYFHTYHAQEIAARSFRGIGPALSWTGSASLLGNRDGGVSFDWSGNAALLFGRQRTRVGHEETGNNFIGGSPYPNLVYQNPPGGHAANRAVTIPNLGGSVGLSWRVQDFKVSMGYRADFFFGAIDGGIDTRKSETLGFRGPFASVSVGLGG
jgi:iron complex outermembrane receptor protein